MQKASQFLAVNKLMEFRKLATDLFPGVSVEAASAALKGLSPASFILPLFARPGKGVRQLIGSMPGHAQLSVDLVAEEAREAAKLGLGGVILFGIPAEKEAVRHALKTSALYHYFRPTLYGKKTHQEVCRWAGLDGSFVAPTIPPSTRPPVISNGLSARANHCLFRAGIPAEKPAVMQALQTGALRPGKRPTNYGKQTHAELCRWAGMDTTALPSP